MARSLTFTIAGEIDTIVLVEEDDFDGDGFNDLRFTVTVDESEGTTADLRGLFWDSAGDDTDGWSVSPGESPDVTDAAFGMNNVTNLGNGANMNGRITSRGNGFDAGVEFGTQGIGKDDIQSTSFVVTGHEENLTLDDIGGMRFGVRLTSYGEIDGPREGSVKNEDVAPNAPDAVADALTTDENSVGTLNILFNDTDADGDPLTVTSIEGGDVGVQYAVTSDAGRVAQVTVNADGSMSVDPNGNFEVLSTGETDSFTLTYHISDGDGGADCADVLVTIEGVNDAPVANSDLFFIESGDTAQFDVAANDTDVDGTVDPSSTVFSGSTGTAATAAGLLEYTAPDVGGDTSDDSFNDAFSYTIDDNEGLTSAPGDVTAQVIDPLVETDTDADAAGNGQNLSLSLSTEDRTYNTSSFYDLEIISGSVDQDVNVSFVIDGSGSVNSTAYNQQLQAVQNAINDLRSAFDANPDADVEVQLVQFASGASGASYDLYDSQLDNVGTGTPISGQTGGATNYEAALDQAVTFFTGQGADDNFMLFASDGQPNQPTTSFTAFTDEVAELEGLNVDRTAVGFGSGVSETALDAVDSDNDAEIVSSAAELGDVFAGAALFPADLLEFSLQVDGTEVADESHLIALGGGDYELDGMLLGLDNTHLALNSVRAEAEFDTDGDGLADEFRFVETFIDGTDGSDILFV